MKSLRTAAIHLAQEQPTGSPLRKALLEAIAEADKTAGDKTAIQNSYVHKALGDALEGVMTASGGLSYRLYNRDGRTDMDGNPTLDPRTFTTVKKAWNKLTKAQNLLQEVARDLRDIDLKYT